MSHYQRQHLQIFIGFFIKPVAWADVEVVVVVGEVGGVEEGLVPVL